jgi:hypothetical protein
MRSPDAQALSINFEEAVCISFSLSVDGTALFAL